MPGRCVQDRLGVVVADWCVGDGDRLDLGTADDLECGCRHVHAMPGESVDCGLAGDEVLVVQPKRPAIAWRLVTVAVVQLDLVQPQEGEHGFVAWRCVDIEHRGQTGHDHGRQFRSVAPYQDRPGGLADDLGEGTGVADNDHEGPSEPFQVGQPHGELMLRTGRCVPVDHECGRVFGDRCGQSCFGPTSLPDPVADVSDDERQDQPLAGCHQQDQRTCPVGRQRDGETRRGWSCWWRTTTSGRVEVRSGRRFQAGSLRRAPRAGRSVPPPSRRARRGRPRRRRPAGGSCPIRPTSGRSQPLSR